MFFSNIFSRRSFIIYINILSLILVLYSGKIDNAFAETFLKTRVETVKSPKLKDEARVKQILRNLEVPEKIGFVKDVHVPVNPSGKMIINIQDLHCNYKAQKNIAAIIDRFITTHGLKVISVEGGSGKIDTTFYKELPDEKIKEQVADYFLREARINGTEYFAITTDRDIALYGAEDEKYYDKNLDAFLRALPSRERILENIAVLENDLNILKGKIYNKKLRDLDDHIVAYDNEALAFEEYIMYISNLYEQENLKKEFKLVDQLVESIQLKNTIILDKAEAQRKELIDYLSKNSSRFDLEEFLRATVEFKAKSMDELTYHNVLRKLYNNMDKKAKTLDRTWPDLDKYIEYLNKHENLDKFELFNEIDKLVEIIKNSLYTSYTQKSLDHNLRVIRLSRSLFATKLLTRELGVIKKYRTDFNAKRMKTFIAKQAKRLKIDLALPSDEDLKEMENTLPDVEDFYHYASQRNNILASNTIKAMEIEGENISLLITGGFHTEGITEYFEEKRISYVVIVPKIEEIDEDDTRYINALQGRKTPFELQLERENKIASTE